MYWFIVVITGWFAPIRVMLKYWYIVFLAFPDLVFPVGVRLLKVFLPAQEVSSISQSWYRTINQKEATHTKKLKGQERSVSLDTGKDNTCQKFVAKPRSFEDSDKVGTKESNTNDKLFDRVEHTAMNVQPKNHSNSNPSIVDFKLSCSDQLVDTIGGPKVVVPGSEIAEISSSQTCDTSEDGNNVSSLRRRFQRQASSNVCMETDVVEEEYDVISSPELSPETPDHRPQGGATGFRIHEDSAQRTSDGLNSGKLANSVQCTDEESQMNRISQDLENVSLSRSGDVKTSSIAMDMKSLFQNIKRVAARSQGALDSRSKETSSKDAAISHQEQTQQKSCDKKLEATHRQQETQVADRSLEQAVDSVRSQASIFSSHSQDSSGYLQCCSSSASIKHTDFMGDLGDTEKRLGTTEQDLIKAHDMDHDSTEKHSSNERSPGYDALGDNPDLSPQARTPSRSFDESLKKPLTLQNGCLSTMEQGVDSLPDVAKQVTNIAMATEPNDTPTTESRKTYPESLSPEKETSDSTNQNRSKLRPSLANLSQERDASREDLAELELLIQGNSDSVLLLLMEGGSVRNNEQLHSLVSIVFHFGNSCLHFGKCFRHFVSRMFQSGEVHVPLIH